RLLLGEQPFFQLLRNWHRENAPLTARHEVSRLTLIRRNRVELVVGPDWDIELLLEIPIEVAERQHQRASFVTKPTFEHRRHELAPGMAEPVVRPDVPGPVLPSERRRRQDDARGRPRLHPSATEA